MSIAACMSLSLGEGLLGEAERLWPTWQERFPALRGVAFPADQTAFLDAHPRAEVDQVLLCLARLAAVDGEDCRVATALLCWIVIPGVSTMAGRLQGRRPRSDLDHLVASALWVRAKAVNWRTGQKVAANLIYNVENDVRSQFAPPRLNVVLCGSVLDLPDQELEEPGRDSRDELDDALRVARRAGKISPTDTHLLRLVLAELTAHPTRVSSSGVMAVDTSAAVGRVLGRGSRAVRYQMARVFHAVRVANRDVA